MSSFCKSYSHFFNKTFQHICVSLNVNFNESLTNDVISFEQLGPEFFTGDTSNDIHSPGPVVWEVYSPKFSPER